MFVEFGESKSDSNMHFSALDVFVEYKSDRVMLIVQSLVVFGEGKSDSNVDFPVIGCVC